MKKLLFLFAFCFCCSQLWAQAKSTYLEGVVVFQSSQNSYVRFASTEGIEKGDTLFISQNDLLKPVLIVNFISSTSCAGVPLDSLLKVEDKVVALVDDIQPTAIRKLKQETDSNLNGISIQDSKKLEEKEVGKIEQKQRINGRLSAISYLNLSNTSNPGYQRFRYNLSLNAKNIANSRLSVETFVSFTHKLNEWSSVQSDIFNGLKVYDLSLNYQLSERTNVLFGRNINPWISSIGAIDGLQANTGFKQFVAGAVAGFRPDYTNYGFNKNLLEYGAYIGHRFKNDAGSMSTTLAFMQQMNQGNIDRRFAYLQFNYSMIKSLRIFLSSELDLFKNIDGVASNSMSLTSIYVNVNYRPNRSLNLNASYDARKNVIYYETFKSYLDLLLEDATRQGIQFRANYRLAKQIGIGASAGYRNRTGDIKPTETLNGFLSFYQIPYIGGTFYLNINYINNSYLNGMIYSALYSRDLLPGKLSADLNFRFVDYNELIISSSRYQYIGEAGIYWQILKGLSLSSTYEATFEEKNQWGMFYLNLSQRF